MFAYTCPGVGHLSGLLLSYLGGPVFRVQHVQGAEGEGGVGLPGGAATRKLVRDDVPGRAGGRVNDLAPGLLKICFPPGGGCEGAVDVREIVCDSGGSFVLQVWGGFVASVVCFGVVGEIGCAV